MGGRKWLLPCSVGLSAVHGLLALVPFVLLWLVVRTLLTAEGNLAQTPLWDYALAAFVMSVAGVALHFVVLMCSRLAAFRWNQPRNNKIVLRFVGIAPENNKFALSR